MFYKEKGEFTRATFFVLPLTFFPATYLAKCYVNCYIRDEYKEKNKKGIFVLIVNNEHGQKLLEMCKTMNNVDSYYEIEDYLMIVYKVMPVFEKDYELFIKGKYSKFSDLAKNTIKAFYNQPIYDKETGKYKKDGTHNILNPTEKDREYWAKEWNVILPEGAEIYSKPNLEEETFRVEKLIPIVQDGE